MLLTGVLTKSVTINMGEGLMKKDIKFSIIMLTYNHEKFIKKAIDSVLEQTYENFELFVVNDGSTDNSDSTIKKFADKRIIYKYQKNKGLDNLAQSYNETLAKCNGEYICILEGDDYWSEKKLEIQYENLDLDVDMAWSKSYYADSKNNVTGKSNISISKKKGKLEDLIKDGVLYGNIITPSPTIIFKKQALQQIGGFTDYDNVKVVDYSTALLLLASGGNYQFIDECLGYYRRHKNQATQIHRSSIYKEHNIILMEVYLTIKGNLDINELNNALAWNDILEKYSDKKYFFVYKYFIYLFLFNNKHKFKYLVLMVFGLIGKNNLYRVRELVRGFF
jgi:glycosyltransferase involved in cell wall biosynthesis